MAKKFGSTSIECACEYNFTCRYCLTNAKPYFNTPSKGMIEADDGDDLNWEYDPNVKENHGKL